MLCRYRMNDTLENPRFQDGYLSKISIHRQVVTLPLKIIDYKNEYFFFSNLSAVTIVMFLKCISRKITPFFLAELINDIPYEG